MSKESENEDEIEIKYQKMKEKFVEKTHAIDELKLKLEKYRQYALEKGLNYIVRFEKDNIGIQREPIKRLLKGDKQVKISLRAIDFVIDFIFDLFQFKIGPFIEGKLKKDNRKTIKSKDLELIFKQYDFKFDESLDLKGIPSVQTKRLLKILKVNVSENANKYFNYLMNKIIIDIGDSGYKNLQFSDNKILSPDHLKKICYKILETLKIEENLDTFLLKQRKLGEFF
ncbi:MAG: hypothetical protein EAX96_05025 [Candidatus Lokiarchaeota archaeon]|nr:hypothetical protein [Candidatus Lokiarchaeota archaeon]